MQTPVASTLLFVIFFIYFFVWFLRTVWGVGVGGGHSLSRLVRRQRERERERERESSRPRKGVADWRVIRSRRMGSLVGRSSLLFRFAFLFSFSSSSSSSSFSLPTKREWKKKWCRGRSTNNGPPPGLAGQVGRGPVITGTNHVSGIACGPVIVDEVIHVRWGPAPMGSAAAAAAAAGVALIADSARQ